MSLRAKIKLALHSIACMAMLAAMAVKSYSPNFRDHLPCIWCMVIALVTGVIGISLKDDDGSHI